MARPLGMWAARGSVGRKGGSRRLRETSTTANAVVGVSRGRRALCLTGSCASMRALGICGGIPRLEGSRAVMRRLGCKLRWCGGRVHRGVRARLSTSDHRPWRVCVGSVKRSGAPAGWPHAENPSGSPHGPFPTSYSPRLSRNLARITFSARLYCSKTDCGATPRSRATSAIV